MATLIQSFKNDKTGQIELHFDGGFVLYFSDDADMQAFVDRSKEDETLREVVKDVLSAQDYALAKITTYEIVKTVEKVEKAGAVSVVRV